MPARRDRSKTSNTFPKNTLGIFVRSPVVGEVKTRLSPPLDPAQARDVYLAFLADLVARLPVPKYHPTIFLAGSRTPELDSILDERWPVVAQRDGTLGDRLAAAFAEMLRTPGDRAVIIGSDSPDLPLPFLKRAFQLLKHRDVVLGPAFDGGYYLIGLRRPAPALFERVTWGSATVFEETLAAIAHERMTLALVPPWYDVDDAASLRFFATYHRARRMAGAEQLPHSARALAVLTGE
jgi:rSAM/selenodomain-associated transferase 1